MTEYQFEGFNNYLIKTIQFIKNGIVLEVFNKIKNFFFTI